MTDSYEDIIHLSHPVSTEHPSMPIMNRAAQFAPFAALTGHDAAIKEAGRITQERIQLSESRIDALNEKLHVLAESIAEQPKVGIVYFQPDDVKKGGAYVKVSGILKKIDDFKCSLLLADGTKIAVENILEIDSALFEPAL